MIFKKKKCPKYVFRMLIILNIILIIVSYVIHFDTILYIFILSYFLVKGIKYWKNPPDVNC